MPVQKKSGNLLNAPRSFEMERKKKKEKEIKRKEKKKKIVHNMIVLS